MKENSSFPLSIQASVLIGSLLISIAILISSGVIKLAGVNPSSGMMGTNALGAATAGVPAAPSPSANPRVAGVTAGDLPSLGNNSSKVLVVEFADYQCPFCEQFFKDTYSQIKKDYIDTGKIKFAFRDYPFLGQPQSDPAGDESTNAANAARCANEQGKFWDYHDYLYTHQGQEDSGAFSKDNLKKFGAALNLNADQFNQCIDSNKYLSATNTDMSDGKGFGVNGTPTVYVNGIELVGAQPYSVFKQVIDQELASAK